MTTPKEMKEYLEYAFASNRWSTIFIDFCLPFVVSKAGPLRIVIVLQQYGKDVIRGSANSCRCKGSEDSIFYRDYIAIYQHLLFGEQLEE